MTSTHATGYADQPFDKVGDATDALLNQRQEVYGDALSTHHKIGQVWSGILGHEVNALQVALMMAGLKLVRAVQNPDHRDSFDDAHGYIRLAETFSE